MKSVEEAMEEAFNELMNEPDEQFKKRVQDALDNPGVFSQMAQDGFVPSSVKFVVES